MAYIRVKQIGTGKIGRIPEENFDPSRYERLDEGLVASLFSPITRSFERMGGLGETMERKKMADEAEKALAAGDYDRAQQLGAMGGKTSPLTAGAREDLTSPLQMTKDLAATASFGVPIAGGAAKPLLKAGALGGFGYGKGETAGEIAGDVAVGAGTSLVLGKALNKFFPGKAAATGEDALKELSGPQKALAQGYIDASPGAYKEAAEHGIDLHRLVVDSLKEASEQSGKLNVPVDDLSALLAKRIADAEKIVQKSVGGSSRKIGTGEFLKELIDLERELGTGLGNKSKIKALGGVIEEVIEKYPKGVPEKTAVKILRQANKEFGKSIAEDTVGAVGAQTNKRFANFIRKSIKGDEAVKQALRTQEESIVLREVLKTTKGKIAARGMPYLGISAAPKTVSKSTRVSSSLLNLGKGPTKIPSTAKTAALETVVGGKAPALAAFMSGQGQQPGATPQTLGAPAAPETPTEEEGLGLSQTDLQLLSMLPAKQQTAILTKIVEGKLLGGGTDAVSRKAITKLDNATAILNQVEGALGTIGLAETSIGARAGGTARKVGAATGIAADPNVRAFSALREGIKPILARTFGEVGNLTEQEQENAIRLLPDVTDSKEEAQAKLIQLRAIIAQMKANY